MVMKKVLLTAYFLTCPWLATALADHRSQQDQLGTVNLGNLDQKREECRAFRNDGQMDQSKLTIKLGCGGSYTMWEEEYKTAYLLTNHESHSSTSTKNRYKTLETSVSGYGLDHEVQCPVKKQKEMSAPENFSIPHTLRDCDDLTVENVRAVCERELHSYCSNQFVVEDNTSRQAQCDQSDQADQGTSNCQVPTQQVNVDGMCVLRTVKVFDGCRGYN